MSKENNVDQKTQSPTQISVESSEGLMSENRGSESTIKSDQSKPTKEIGGPKGLEPTRYGDWEAKGRCYDF